jgi:hypothetical protein
MKKNIAVFTCIVLNALFIVPVSGADISSKIDSATSLVKGTAANPGQSGKPGPDSLQKTTAPTAAPGALSHADSLAKTAVRDSLLLEKSKYLARFKKFPVSIDSLFSPTRLDQSYLFTSDAIGLSEAMRGCQQVVSVPFSLSSALNRSMIYGFPLPGLTLYSNESMLGENTNALKGSDAVTSMQLSNSPFGAAVARAVHPAPFGTGGPRNRHYVGTRGVQRKHFLRQVHAAAVAGFVHRYFFQQPDVFTVDVCNQGRYKIVL